MIIILMFFINGCNSMSNPDSKTAMCLEFVVIFHHSKDVSEINSQSLVCLAIRQQEISGTL